MFNWLINQTPNPVLFDVGVIKIYWYGFLVASAIVIGLWLVSFLYRKYNFDKNIFWDICFYVILFAFLGDRLAHVLLYNWDYYSQNLIDILKIWQGGLAIHGAIFIGLLTLYFIAQKHKLSFAKLGDVFVPAMALGLAIGRWGNYFNQEIYGRPAQSWFSIPIDLLNRVEGYEMYERFLPMFFYAFLMNIFIFIILIGLHYLKLKKIRDIKDGFIMISFLVLYGAGRFVIEFWRIDAQSDLIGLRTGQWLSLGLIALGLAMIVYRKSLIKKQA